MFVKLQPCLGSIKVLGEELVGKAFSLCMSPQFRGHSLEKNCATSMLGACFAHTRGRLDFRLLRKRWNEE